MQPRLVAISYPSVVVEEEGNKAKRFSKFKPFRRAKSEAEANSNQQGRWSEKLRRFTWHDLKSQVSLSGRKRSRLNEDVTYDVQQPWSEAFLHDSGFASKTGVKKPAVSKWQTLPSSVQAVIIQHVESAYSHMPDPNAYALRRRDVMALQSNCKAWSVVSQTRLYQTIQLKPNYDYDWSTAPPKVRHTRLLQLRRTLRSNARLADLVKHLMLVPENQCQEGEQIAYSDLVASIVIVCPNLQSLTSFHVPYTHNFDRLHHALASRTELRKHTWVIGDDPLVRTRAGRRMSAGILSSQQTRLFIHYHALWRNLEELTLISHNGKGILENNLFVKTFKMLPSLQRLHVSSFDANDFTDQTLLSLPPLTSLKIDRCPGITESGLCQWAQSPEAAGTKRLVLEGQRITSLLTIAAIFATLPRLESFRMVQLEFEPGLPLELDVQQPLLESASLKTLEWFVACGWDPDVNKFQETSSPEKLHEQLETWSHSKATQHILSSILDYGFPALKKILLPGYGNLSGLLRWVRHTAPDGQQDDLVEVAQRPTLTRYPQSAPLVRLRRDGSRLSLRPASPTFTQYDHWQKAPMVNVPEVSHTTIAEQPSPSSPVSPMGGEETKATDGYFNMPSPSPFEQPSGHFASTIAVNETIVEDTDEHSDNDTDGFSDEDDEASTLSPPSSESSTPTPASPISPTSKDSANSPRLSRSSTIIASHTPAIADSDEETIDADADTDTETGDQGLFDGIPASPHVRFNLGPKYNYATFSTAGDDIPITPLPTIGLPEDILRIGWGCVPGWGNTIVDTTTNEHLDVMGTWMPATSSKRDSVEVNNSNNNNNNNNSSKKGNRNSSISILLDGYAYTA